MPINSEPVTRLTNRLDKRQTGTLASGLCAEKDERERERWGGFGETMMNQTALIAATWLNSKTLMLILHPAIVVRREGLCKPSATLRRLSLVNSSESARKLNRYSGIALASASLCLSPPPPAIILLISSCIIQYICLNLNVDCICLLYTSPSPRD